MAMAPLGTYREEEAMIDERRVGFQNPFQDEAPDTDSPTEFAKSADEQRAGRLLEAVAAVLTTYSAREALLGRCPSEFVVAMEDLKRAHDLSRNAEHCLKCDCAPFAEILAGTKTYEVRPFDRDYRVGDYLVLMEHDRSPGAPSRPSGKYTGRRCRVRVTSITPPKTYGLPDNVGVLGIRFDPSEHPPPSSLPFRR